MFSFLRKGLIIRQYALKWQKHEQFFSGSTHLMKGPVNKNQSLGLVRHFTPSNNGRVASKLTRMGMAILFAGAVSGLGYNAWVRAVEEGFVVHTAARVVQIDYRQVYKAIEQVLDDPTYDDASYGPIFVRLAWHASGTFDKLTNTGGCSKGTMRFDPEANFLANKGLDNARKRLEIVKKQFPMISYGDLWTLAAVCAVQEMGGPIIPWKPGRIDGKIEDTPPDGRLPDATNPDPAHPREVFYRMGFNDQEICCLMGAHGLGRCHKENSGFDGPWTFSPTSFSNEFYVQLLSNEWTEKQWSGNKQFEDPTGHLMMSPADMSFKSDPAFRKWSEIYAKDETRFFCDFVKAYTKLIELGVEFPENVKTYKFKRTLT